VRPTWSPHPGSAARSGSWVQLAPEPRCNQVGNIRRTWRVRDAPVKYYGFQVNHIFNTPNSGCSLTGSQVSERVTVARDDFQTGYPGEPLGKTIWTLTGSHALDRPDHIYSQAGRKGLGVNPLRTWPALLTHDQIFYYRRSPQDHWNIGPGHQVRVTLSGDPKNAKTLRVTTTVRGESRTENYRGPPIKLWNPP